ncbi:Neudesin [Dactylellina cionopaga]|nr:Neudesin [Dactylellina cionopaga]
MVQTRKQAREATPDPKSIDDTTEVTPTKSKSKAKLIKEEDQASFGVLDLLRIIAGVAVFSCMLSYFIIGDSYVWGQDKLVRKYWNGVKKTWTKPIYLDEATLSLYNGTDETLPIYLSINGTIYDVTEGKNKYGPGGGYSFFGMIATLFIFVGVGDEVNRWFLSELAGRDASRAYITGDFKNDLTWDVSDIDEERVQRALGHWVKFFASHDIYTFVGYLVRDPNKAKKPEPKEEPKVEPEHNPDEL